MANQSGLGSKGQKPSKDIECMITQAVTMKKAWSVWQSEHDAFLTARGDLVTIDELAFWEEGGVNVKV